MKVTMDGGGAFLLPGGSTGCLLVHGFTGTPKEMRRVGEALSGDGHTVLGVRLFAHATEQTDMGRARWRDWIASVEDGLALLGGLCERVVLVGLSMGGALSLLSTRHPIVCGAVVMATPHRSPDARMKWLRPALPAASRVFAHAAKPPAHWHDPAAAEGHLEYPSYPIRAVAELHDLLGVMREELARVRVPVLLVYSTADRTVTPAHGEAMHAALRSTDATLEWVHDSSHDLPNDAEHSRVAELVRAFVRARG